MEDYEIARFYLGKPGTEASTVYTVPAGQTVILRHIAVSNTTDTAAKLCITVTSGGADVEIVPNIEITKLFDWATERVLQDGDSIKVSQTTAGSLTLELNGVVRVSGD